MLRLLGLGLALALVGQDRFKDKTAESALGMATAEHRLGAEAGAAILEKGGNAVDAAVASAFAMSVALPSHSGPGGRSQLLVVLKDGRAFHVDGGTEVPALSGADAETGGWKSICTPGSVAALAMAHKEAGSLAWKDVLAPAIELAKEKNATLAGTLAAIADDWTSLYTGKLAETIDEEMQEHGGFVRKSDLAAYKAVKRDVLKTTFRGYELVTCDKPASGMTVLEALNILETFDWSKLEGADREHVTIEALRLAFEDRHGVDNGSRLSKDYAKKRAGEIDLKKAGQPKLDRDDEGDTTHISVVDADGNACAFTQSLGPWFGAGKSKLGFYWNATQGVAGRVAAGKRHTTGQSPTILIKDGKPALVVGSAGESRIISAVAQTIHRVVHYGQPLRDAVFAPRWHWEGASLTVESRVAASELNVADGVMATLKERGFRANLRRSDAMFGRVQACVWDVEKKTWTGVADPRGTGAARGATRRKRRRAGGNRKGRKERKEIEPSPLRPLPLCGSPSGASADGASAYA